VSAILHRCLSPDPTARPTAPAIRAALSGRAPKTITAAALTGTHPGPEAGTASAPRLGSTEKLPAAPGVKLTSDRIRFVTTSGAFLQIGIRTEIGKAVLRRFGPDAEFWDDKQCTVERRGDGQWIVTPSPGTTNETLINGARLTTPRALSEGDVLAAGRSAKGISKLPLTAHAG
jgi:eukaryotic-like serine/threonine-protein kinase